MKVLWPFGAALAGVAPNRLMLRWLKTVVVSDEEKAHVMRQVGTGKTTTVRGVEMMRRHQNRGALLHPWEESGGCGGIGQAVSGV